MISLGAPGMRVALGGKIGKDDLGDVYLEQLDRHCLISELKRGDGPTGTSIIVVTPDGERNMNTHLGMCREFSPDDVNEDLVAQACIFYSPANAI